MEIPILLYLITVVSKPNTICYKEEGLKKGIGLNVVSTQVTDRKKMMRHLDREKYSEESEKAQMKIIQDHVWDARGVYNSTNNGIQVGNNRIHATKNIFYCIYKVFHTLSNHKYDPLMLLLTMVTRTASEPTEGRSDVPSSPLLKEMGYYQIKTIKTLVQETCD